MCDFQSVYHLDWDTQVWTGEPDTTERLLAGLSNRPDSMLRAALMEELPATPPTTGDNRLTLDWYGMSQDTRILSQLFNMVSSLFTKDGPRYAFPRNPIDEFWERTHNSITH